MSLSYHPLNLCQTLEPRTRIYNERDYCVFRGGQVSTWKPAISTSFSDSSIQISAPPPNPKILVDRKVLLNVNPIVTLNGDAGVGNLLYNPLNGNAAPRSHPLQRIITTQTVTLNNTEISSNASDVADPLFWYWSDAHKREIDDSLSPCMNDQSQQYADLNGGSRNPLNNYASSNSGADISRGSFPITVISNTRTQAILLLNLTDYLYLPPFLSDGKDGPGFIGLQTMDFNFTLGNLSLVWSSYDPLVTSVSVTISKLTGGVIPPAPQLLFNYITPDPLMEVPSSVVYPYYTVQRYPTQVGTVLPGVSTTMQTNNIQLKSIPNKIYILARRQNSDNTYATTNTFARIDKVNIDWNNNSGLLASATPMDLFHMSQASGLQMSWPQFNNQVGGIICLTMGRDICLQANEAPGLLGTFNLVVQLGFTNISSSTINFNIYIITVSEGTFTITDNRAVSNIGVISSSDVLNSLGAPLVPYNDLIDQRGGSFWGNLKNFFSDVGRGVKQAYDTVAPIVRTVAPYIGPARALLGVGAYSGGVLSGGATAQQRKEFLAMIKKSGQKHTRAQLKKMYKEMYPPVKKVKAKKKGNCKMVYKKCPTGTRKRCVPTKKGAALYGGELIDREMMRNVMENDMMGGSALDNDSDNEYYDENLDLTGGNFLDENSDNESNEYYDADTDLTGGEFLDEQN